MTGETTAGGCAQTQSTNFLSLKKCRKCNAVGVNSLNVSFARNVDNPKPAILARVNGQVNAGSRDKTLK